MVYIISWILIAISVNSFFSYILNKKLNNKKIEEFNARALRAEANCFELEALLSEQSLIAKQYMHLYNELVDNIKDISNGKENKNVKEKC